MTDQNPVNELIQIEKENQKLLGQLLASQEELIEITRSQRNQGRWKLFLEGGKLIMWPLILILSFYFSMQVIKGFTQNLTRSVNPVNIIENFRGNDKPAPDGTENLDVGRINQLLDLIGQ